MTWSLADVPDQTGRTAVVTGANGGLGLEATRMLAGAGAHVVCTDIDEHAAEATAAGDAALAEVGPGAVTEVERGDADDTEAWEVEVVTDAGEEWHVELDADLAVIGSHLDD